MTVTSRQLHEDMSCPSKSLSLSSSTFHPN